MSANFRLDYTSKMEPGEPTRSSRRVASHACLSIDFRKNAYMRYLVRGRVKPGKELALEWHVDLLNSLQYFTFEFVSGFHHSIIFLLSAFPLTWFKAIRSVGNSMSGNSVE